MTREETIKLFDIIRQDDLSSFCALNSKTDILNISFGRFPILSVCYLYNSKKIIRCFGKRLLEKTEFESVFEPIALYKDFKPKAGKSLRFYAGKADKIMPIEMLAILGKDRKVKRYFKHFSKDEKIKRIYDCKNQKAEIYDKKIKISHKKMKKGAKITLLSIFISIIFIGALFGGYVGIYGLGTEQCPRQVYSEAQFSKIGENETIKLQRNLTFKSNPSFENFKGTINGNGKTIKIKQNTAAPFFEEFSGEIKNLNIEVVLDGFAVGEDFALLAQTNDGKIENTKITFSSNVEMNIEENSNFALFADTNNGTIENCKVRVNIEISKSGTKDAAFSPFASVNNGTITNCETEIGSSITAENVDVCGIAAENYSEITSSKNYSSISQTSTLAEWSPNVAGISLLNQGTISDCVNFGELSAINEMSAESATIFVGGICAINYAVISHTKNLANIIASTNDSVIVAGGISAFCRIANYDDNPTIESCGTEGDFDVSKNSDSAYIFCGGIAGAMRGTLLNSYSLSTFKNGSDTSTRNQTGLIFGLSYGSVSMEGIIVYLNISSVYCMSVENVSKTLSVVNINGAYYTDGVLNADITACTKEEIESTEIYLNLQQENT